MSGCGTLELGIHLPAMQWPQRTQTRTRRTVQPSRRQTAAFRGNHLDEFLAPEGRVSAPRRPAGEHLGAHVAHRTATLQTTHSTPIRGPLCSPPTLCRVLGEAGCLQVRSGLPVCSKMFACQGDREATSAPRASWHPARCGEALLRDKGLGAQGAMPGTRFPGRGM